MHRNCDTCYRAVEHCASFANAVALRRIGEHLGSEQRRASQSLNPLHGVTLAQSG
jgi:hypothetical protein